MNKAEFLDQLRISLNGKMDAAQIEDILRYYQDYIESQMRDGMAESEVMASLGAPRLIARSIIDAGKGFTEEQPQPERRQSSYEREPDRSQGTRNQGQVPFTFRMLSAPRWARGLIAFGILAFFVALLVIVLKFLLPVILLFMVTGFLVKLFRDWLK